MRSNEKFLEVLRDSTRRSKKDREPREKKKPPESLLEDFFSLLFVADVHALVPCFENLPSPLGEKEKKQKYMTRERKIKRTRGKKRRWKAKDKTKKGVDFPNAFTPKISKSSLHVLIGCFKLRQSFPSLFSSTRSRIKESPRNARKPFHFFLPLTDYTEYFSSPLQNAAYVSILLEQNEQI